MTVRDPATAPRERESGYKGDAWTVTMPSSAPDDAGMTLILDTGLDSVAIVGVANGWWDRSTRASVVRVHDRYDETILIPRGSGTLYHGADRGDITRSRFAAPVTLVLPAGCWHHVAMDPDVRVQATAFFTVPGTVIAPFSVQMEIVTRARIPFGDLPVVHPRPVEAELWSRPATVAAGSTSVDDVATESIPLDDAAAGADGSVPVARILPYPPRRDGLTMPLDTGRDSLFILAGAPDPDPPEPSPVPPNPVLLDLPGVVDVHRHPDVDEYILRHGGAGYILNGPTPETITLTPFRGPCLLVMPAGAFHRIVQTEDDQVGGGFLIYADRRAVVEPYGTIMATTRVASVSTTD
jgi:hypothetical protein